MRGAVARIEKNDQERDAGEDETEVEQHAPDQRLGEVGGGDIGILAHHQTRPGVAPVPPTSKV